MNNLDALFHPRSVAVVGASESPLKVSHYPLKNIIDKGFTGEIYPVNPRLSQVLGLKVYPSLEAIPTEVDMVFIGVAAHMVPSILEECSRKGVKGAVITTAGFKEYGIESGAKLQEEIAAIANKADIKIIGPNTIGFVNPYANLNATIVPTFKDASRGNIAVVSQSGGVCSFLLNSMIDQNLGISMAMSLGNRVNVDFADAVEYLGEHQQTRVIALYIEGLDDPRRFIEAARKVTIHKPIVAYKGGGGSLSRASYSHTGSLAGSHEAYNAAFSQSGILAIDDSAELIDVAKALAFQNPPRGNRVAILSLQAGTGIIAAQACQRNGLALADFSAEGRGGLEEIIGPYFFTENPVDLGGMWIGRDVDYRIFRKILGIILREEGVDAIVAIAVYGPLIPPFIDAHVSLAKDKELTKPVFFCCDSPKGSAYHEITKLENSNIPVYPFPERAVRALAGLVRCGEARQLTQ
ncbi:acetate--CoA ligase family protein [Chloroflexota bacterium]